MTARKRSSSKAKKKTARRRPAVSRRRKPASPGSDAPPSALPALTDEEQETRGPGRPRIEIDTDLLMSLAKVGCTYEEIAGVFADIGTAISTDTLKRNFADYIEKGRFAGKASLRRKQWQKAVTDGNVTMLIWLGKQELGQRDRSDIKHTAGLGIADLLDDVPEDEEEDDEGPRSRVRPDVPLARGNRQELPA